MMREINFYSAYQDGVLRQVAGSREELLRLCPEVGSPGWDIRFTVATAHVAEGIVIDWNAHGGSAAGPKIHWQCPACGGQEHWADLDLADGNAALWFCESGSGDLVLVHWRYELPSKA